MSDNWWEEWRKRRRRWPLFRSLFEDIDEFMREFEKQMEEEFKWIMERAPRELIRERTTKDGVVREVGPFVYGYSITIGPDGKPIIREFGNVRPGALPAKSALEVRPEREPLVDVIEEDNRIKVVAELPGVRKEDIELSVDERMMTVKVDTESRKYFKEIELPAVVDPNTAKASYNNGVLEVVVEKKAEAPKKGHRVKIE